MKFQKSIVLSASVSALLLVSGCGSDSNTETLDKVSPITIDGKAVDGYLRFATVCLDLDNNGYCQIGTEPAASTEPDGSYSLSVTATQQQHPNFSTAKLIVFGGQDSDTGKDFSGKMVSAFDKNNANAVFITPLSTMVSAVKDADGTLSKDEAEEKVAKLLGLTKEKLNSDPIAASKAGDDTVLSKALELQKAVEVLAANEGSADVKAATDNVYKALASGVSSSPSSTTGVVGILENADKNKLGTDASKVLSAAVVLAKKVEDAVKNMEKGTGVDTTKAIAAVANTVDNVKKVIDTEVKAQIDANVAGDVDTTSFDDLDVTDNAVVVTTADVDKVVVVNVVQNSLGENVVLTDAQLEAILAQAGDDDNLNNLEDIQIALEEASKEEGGEELLGSINDQVTIAAQQEEEEQKLLEAVDTSLTIETILTKTGMFEVDVEKNYTTGEISLYIQRTLVEAGEWVDSYLQEDGTYKAESSENMQTGEENKYITIVDGKWVTMDEEQDGNDFSFDTQNNLHMIDHGVEKIYTAVAYSADTLNIANIIYKSDDNDLEDAPTVAVDATFSSGAKYYEILETTTSEAVEESEQYELWYYNGTWDYETGEEVFTPGNKNKVVYYTTNTYTNLNDFITKNSDNDNNSYPGYSFEDTNSNSTSGYIRFTGENTVSLISQDWDADNNQNIVTTVEGSYLIDTLDGKRYLELSFNGEIGSSKQVFVEDNNVVKDGQIDNINDIKQLQVWDYMLTYDTPTSYTSVSNFIEKNTYNGTTQYQFSNLYGYNEEESMHYQGYFGEGNTVNYYYGYYDDTTNTFNYGQSDFTGTYEVKTVGSTEILIVKKPDALKQSWEKDDGDRIYSMQDNELREGSIQIQESNEDSSQTEVFYLYNEIAAKDILSAIQKTIDFYESNPSIPANTSTGKICLAEHFEKDLTKEDYCVRNDDCELFVDAEPQSELVEVQESTTCLDAGYAYEVSPQPGLTIYVKVPDDTNTLPTNAPARSSAAVIQTDVSKQLQRVQLEQEWHREMIRTLTKRAHQGL